MAMNLLSGLQYVQQQGEAGRQRGLEDRFNRLAGEAFNAQDNATRDAAVGQVAVNNPRAAFGLQAQFQANDDRQTKLLVNGARYMKGALDSKNPNAVAGAWRTVRPSLIRAGLATEQELSPEWDPSYEQTVHQVLAMGDGAGSGNVQSTYIDGDGNRVAIMRDGSTQVLGRNDAGANQQTLTIDVNGVPTQVTFDRRTGRYTNASLDAPVQTSMGAYIDPNLPAEVQSQIRQSLAAGQEPPSQMVFAGSPLVGRRKEDEAAAVEAAKQRAQLDYLPQAEAIRGQADIERARGVEQAKAGVERDSKMATRTRDANDAIGLISEARRLLPGATGGTLAALGDRTAAFFGKGTAGAQANAALKTIAGQLTAKQPRMEGPQSDRDVQMYKDMAGDVANENLPVSIRMAALDQIERLHQKYASGVQRPAGPSVGTVEDGYRFRGGNPADPNNWERL